MDQKRGEIRRILGEGGVDNDDLVDRIYLELVNPPDSATTGRLWLILVSGLLVLILIAAVGVLWATLDGNKHTSPTVIVTVFSSLLTGLLGLFVASPTTK